MMREGKEFIDGDVMGLALDAGGHSETWAVMSCDL